MRKYYHVWILAFALAVVFGGLTCSDTKDDEKSNADPYDDFDGTPLTFGDASWEKAPLGSPGSGGEDDPKGTVPGHENGEGLWGDPTSDENYNGRPGGDAEQEGDISVCPEYEPCEEVVWCEEDLSTISICTYAEDPDNPGCIVPVLEVQDCPEGTECRDEGSVACYEIPIEGPLCPDTREPTVLYMSNDDSNSQASPALCRAKIREGGIVYPYDVRMYEFINYFDLSYDNSPDHPAVVGMQMRRTDADTGEFTLLLYAQGRKMSQETRRPLNLVLSLDTSGSMSGYPISVVRQLVREIAGVLKEGDLISMVEWSSSQNVVLEAYNVTGPDDPTLLTIADGLEANGSTDLHGGLVRAYQLARDSFQQNRINRVIIISDGGANTGITDIDLIAAEADDSNGEGIYLVGVGADDSANAYNDRLMDNLTDAGKGAYIYLDNLEETHKMFGEPDRFLANIEVAARDVRMELTMPWYFRMKEFHGEEYSENPEEVEPQHLAPNDAMSYHQIVQACNPDYIMIEHKVKAKVTFKDPVTRAELTDELLMPIGDILQAPAGQLRKGDVVVGYAKGLIVIGFLWSAGEKEGALETAAGMAGWLDQAARDLGDSEISEMASLMDEYVSSLRQKIEDGAGDYGY